MSRSGFHAALTDGEPDTHARGESNAFGPAMPFDRCECGHSRGLHTEGVGCMANGGNQTDVFCACQQFVSIRRRAGRDRRRAGSRGEKTALITKVAELDRRYQALRDELNEATRGRRIRVTGTVRDQPIGSSKPLLTGREYTVTRANFDYREPYVFVEGIRTGIHVSDLEFLDDETGALDLSMRAGMALVEGVLPGLPSNQADDPGDPAVTCPDCMAEDGNHTDDCMPGEVE